MDILDLALRAAWNRISKRVRRERLEALKRSQRRFTRLLTTPARENCLVIRAGDKRINDYNAIIDPLDAWDARDAHSVTICGELVRELTKPIVIPWPGVTYAEAARICGREYGVIARWAKRGLLHVDRYPAFNFPRDGKRPLKPQVWTPSPIDPSAIECRAPHRAWGSLWQGRWEKIPVELEFTVERVPEYIYCHGQLEFRGWHFICPGKVDENENYTGCGRQCRFLYCPVSMWTLGRAMNDLSGFDMPEDSGLAGQWAPALHKAVQGPHSFACRECWNIHSRPMTDAAAWNAFIAHISGGLLYGREVKRPRDLPLEKKRKKRRWAKMPEAKLTEFPLDRRMTQNREGDGGAGVPVVAAATGDDRSLRLAT